MSKKLKKQSKRLKQLTGQINRLQEQLEGLQAPGDGPAPAPSGSASPTGPAGGDLIGTFPNPLIRGGAVGTAEIANDAVTTAKIDNGAVDRDDIGAGAVGNFNLAPNAVDNANLGADIVTSDELRAGSVGASELKNVTTAVSASGAYVTPGAYNSTRVTCPDGTMLIAGGFAWRDNEPNSIIHSAPDPVAPSRSWMVRGYVPSGSGVTDNLLFGWATCLAT